MGKDKDILVSESDIKLIQDVAVLGSKMEGIQGVVPKIFNTLERLDKSVQDIPLQIHKCGGEMELDLKDYIHEEFVTKTELKLFESKLEIKLNKSTWITSGMISAAVALGWLSKYTTIFGVTP